MYEWGVASSPGVANGPHLSRGAFPGAPERAAIPKCCKPGGMLTDGADSSDLPQGIRKPRHEEDYPGRGTIFARHQMEKRRLHGYDLARTSGLSIARDP